MIVIIDFGSQTTHLISRRLNDLGVGTEIVDPSEAYSKAKKQEVAGLIFSGGPASVYEKGAPKINKRVFDLGLPILGICYGWQLMADFLGGRVELGKKEYGPAILTVTEFADLFYGLPEKLKVWESHGDTVVKVPYGFQAIASTDQVNYAAVRQQNKKMFAVQFHPEMQHTEYGEQILKNFASRVCGLALRPKRLAIRKMVEEIKRKVAGKQVIGAVSGGTDSSVAGALVAKAIGRQFIPVYIDSGLMREETLKRIKKDLPRVFGVPVKIVHARNEFLRRLKGVIDPEKKRKIIGKMYIDLFEREMKRYQNVKYLLQGTTYADFIHSQGSQRSALIKSHHNVGGLPKKMKLKLLEPLRYYYTDQVREIGHKLGLPKRVILQQPFPGPGQAIRIVGEITRKRLKQQVQADRIVIEELKKAGWYSQVFQSWSIMTGAKSTAIKGDSRFYGEVVAIRVVNSKDRMTADWTRLPDQVLTKMATRIVNEVPGVSRVVYDITTKPPATMEWE